MINYLADIALAIAALGCVVFVITYQLLADWRATPVGRNVMAFMACCAVLLCIGVIRAFVDLSESTRGWIRLVGFVLVAYIVWRRVYLLIRAQLSERNRTDVPGTPGPVPEPERGHGPLGGDPHCRRPHG